MRGMRGVITDDITAWETIPRSRWMLNKLYVQQAMGYDCGPLGVVPEEYPVCVKPVINMYGLGIKSKIVEHHYELTFEPGMMWMPYYKGNHISYDISYKDGEIIEAYAAKGLNGPNFTEWRVDKIQPDQNLKDLVYSLSLCGELPQHFNIETIDDNLIECHPRWSEEFVEYYSLCPFTQKVLWSEDITCKLPETWIDCRHDSSNDHMGNLKRIGFTYEFDQ